MDRRGRDRPRRVGGPVAVGGIAVVTALVAATILVAAPAAPAWAHASLVRSVPKAGAVLADGPDAVELTFSEPVRVVAARTAVTGPDGRRADAGPATSSGDTVRIPLRPDPARGSYLVSYRVSSADGHPVGGGFSFAVGAPSPVPPAQTGRSAGAGAAGGATVDPVVAVALGAARYAGHAGLALLTGVAVVLAALWPRRLGRRGPARVARIGMALLGAATLAALYLQAAATTGAGVFGATGGDLRDVLASRFGQAHLVRLGVLAVVAVLIGPLLAGRDRRTDRWLLLGVGLVGLATWPLSGHPGTAPLPWLAVPADMAHLAAMSVWLGGLVMLVGFLLPRTRPAELAAILPAWSRWAAAAVATLAAGGVTQAVIELGGWGNLTGTTYGRLLLGKAGLLLVLLLIAWYARRLTAPGRVRLRRAVIAELGISAVVLGLTAALLATTPARVAGQGEPAPAGVSVPLRTALYTAELDVEPGRTGLNEVHLYVSGPDGGPVRVEQWRARASLPGRDLVADVPLLPAGEAHAIGQVNLPVAGRWEFSVTLRTSEIDEATATATVPVG